MGNVPFIVPLYSLGESTLYTLFADAVDSLGTPDAADSRKIRELSPPVPLSISYFSARVNSRTFLKVAFYLPNLNHTTPVCAQRIYICAPSLRYTPSLVPFTLQQHCYRLPYMYSTVVVEVAS